MNSSIGEISCHGDVINWGGKEYPMPPIVPLSYFGKAVEWLNANPKIRDYVMYRPSCLFKTILGGGIVYASVYYTFTATPWALLGLAIVPLYLALKALQIKITAESVIENTNKRERDIAIIYDSAKENIKKEKLSIVSILGGEEAFNRLPTLKIADVLNPTKQECQLIGGVMKGVDAHCRPFIYMKVAGKEEKRHTHHIFFYQYKLNTNGEWKCSEPHGTNPDGLTPIELMDQFMKNENPKYKLEYRWFP